MTCRCSCGFSTASLERFEDHLFTFPEDDHYELASGHQDHPAGPLARPDPLTHAPLAADAGQMPSGA
jgi:hypothetical protein